jgi:L-fuconolactonase
MRGLEAVEKAGLSYDLLIFPRQLPAAVELAKRFPGLRLVLDHLAKPPIKEGRMTPWADDLRQLAASPNVSCKVSGLLTEGNWKNWKSSDFQPYLATALDAFGPERLIFGSDWPVCSLAGSYAQVFGLVDDFVSMNCPGSRESIFGGHARRFYHVGNEENL